MIKHLINDLKSLSTPDKAKTSAWFFKTGAGQYGEGDIFIGVTVPQQRKIAKKYKEIDISEIAQLLSSKIHEHRLTALMILGDQFKKANLTDQTKIAKFYVKNSKLVNNWDLVDLSAPNILGPYLLNRNRNILYKLAKSKNLWQKRIAVISTYAFIRDNQFEDTFKIAQILINDTHDLIHKAVGWMLREVGKRDVKKEESFLQKHYKTMPRTMLRYSIEKFPENKRKFYLFRG